jgi:hypothetical protein
MFELPRRLRLRSGLNCDWNGIVVCMGGKSEGASLGFNEDISLGDGE